jgi:hypothetical protein
MKKENIFFSNVSEIGASHEPIEKFATGNRITPQPSATSVKEGTIAFSDGGDLCYTKKDKNGVGRWFSAGLKYDYNNLLLFKLKQKWSGTKGNYDGNVIIEFSTRNDLDPIRIDFWIVRLDTMEYEFNASLYALSDPANKTRITDLKSTKPSDAYKWFDEADKYVTSSFKAFTKTIQQAKYETYQLQNLVSMVGTDLKMKFNFLINSCAKLLGDYETIPEKFPYKLFELFKYVSYNSNLNILLGLFLLLR